MGTKTRHDEPKLISVKGGGTLTDLVVVDIALPDSDTRPRTVLTFEEVVPGDMQIFARVSCPAAGDEPRRMILGRITEPRTLNPLVQFFSPMGAALVIEISQLIVDRKHLGW